MTKKIKLSLINNSRTVDCEICGSEGRLYCYKCDGTGKYIETHYIIVDEVNKIAIDSDSEDK